MSKIYNLYHFIRKQISVTFIFIIVCVCLTTEVYAQSVPPLVNYQGRLTDANGDPQTGQKKLEFNIYDAATDGNLVWGPQVFDPVYLIDGRFNVILGTTDQTGRSIADAFGDSERFIGITVDDGTEIAPRQQILSVPYAVRTHFEIPVGGVIMWWGNTADIRHPSCSVGIDKSPPSMKDARNFLHFEYLFVKLFDFNARDYYDHPNPVVNILLPKMHYAPEERVDVIWHAYVGLFRLVSRILFDKYVDFIDIYAEVTEKERETIQHALEERKESVMIAQYIRKKQ